MELNDYLETLTKEQLIKLYKHKSGVELADGCGKEPVGNGGTPNGHWACIGGVWEWIPEIG